MESESTNRLTRTELLRGHGRTRVTRLFFRNRTLIRKEPLGSDAEARLAHEAAILERLRGVDGVAQLLDTPRYPGSIVLEDAGGESLATRVKPFELPELIEVATGLARTVASMHARGVIHRDIHPGNVLWSREGGCCLVDFAQATTLAEIRPQFTHPGEIVGALPYVAPEQTGRTGRSVDHRADLYALGSTLYEVATGAPPFGAGDPLRLIHDHLARVPVPPAQRNAAIPPFLSEIVTHLLEKEPDKRYQSADGVVHDLTAAAAAAAAAERGPPTAVRIGGHDVPLRLHPPSRLVGRDHEVQTLHDAFQGALVGSCRGLLVSGAPGVGKTAMVDQLRSMVAQANGWFVTGKFDQYQRDVAFNAAYQAFQALARLLLAEPDAQLNQLRPAILEALGRNAGLLTAVIPEWSSLLGLPPDPGDPLTAQARAQRVAVDALRVVATPERPLVLVMDDLQWGGRTPLGFIDVLFGERPIEGLLFVGAYREAAVDPAHPLAAPLLRWSDQASVWKLRLEDLPVPALGDLVAEILRVDVGVAARLAEVIEPHTRGNPYETIELLNALRSAGLLAVTSEGWRWDEATMRAHLRRLDVTALLGARVAAMPSPSQRLVGAMACLGGRVELPVLEAASGLPAAAVVEALAPAVAEGLLVMDPGARDAVRFGHDRIRDAVLAGLDRRRRDELHLDLARRLSQVPELFAVAAEQYLPVVAAVHDAGERRRAVRLLRLATDQASLYGDHALINRLMTAAVELLDPDDGEEVAEVHTARHAARVSMGLFDEADDDYRAIVAVRRSAPERPVTTQLQVHSLTHRGRLQEANELGIAGLRECGIDVPAADELPAELDRRLENLFRWLNETEDADDLAKPDVADPRLLTAGRLLDGMLAPAFFLGDLRLYAWVGLQTLQIWVDHGPAPPLTGAAANAVFQFVAERGDYAAMYRAARRIVEVGEARGYQPATEHARNVFSLVSCWFEPFEASVAHSQRAFEGLIAGGDLTNAGYTLHGYVGGLLHSAASLGELVAVVDEGLAFQQRTGGEQAGLWLDEYRWLAGVLDGTLPRPAGEAAPISRHAGNPLSVCHVYVTRAVAAAIFGDAESLDRHTEPLPSLGPTVVGWSVSALAHPLRGLALAWRLRETPDGDRADLLRELDAVMSWLVARAVDAPANFLHLLHLVEAELAWTREEFQAAAANFDAALREVTANSRPWQEALITERAARFHLAHGLEHLGYDLLARARERYGAWGATAKAEQLDWSPAVAVTGAPAPVTAGAIDLVGVLSASQALSSETSIERLHHRVVEVVSAMTGATGVRLITWSDERNGWVLPHGGTASAGDEPAAPASVLRYVQRTGAPVVVGDAVADERFARDLYFAGLDLCSLLAVPVFGRGRLRAVLLLENRLIRGAFSTERLDAINLIAGQLAVSLDNAELYARFRLVADEQAALRRVATLVARSVEPTELFSAVTEEVGRLLDADLGGMIRFLDDDMITPIATWAADGEHLPVEGTWSLEGDRLATAIAATGLPKREDDWASAEGPIAAFIREHMGVRSSVGSPVLVEGCVWGALFVHSTRNVAMPPDTEQRLVNFSELVATAIANMQARADLAASRVRLVAAADDERRRVVRDLHDGAQQRLVHTIITLKLAGEALDRDPATARGHLAEALDHAQAATSELRELSHGIMPAVLTNGGLRSGVRALASRAPVPVSIDVVSGRLPAAVESTAYFVVAEALTNVSKHAQATSATITARVDHDDHQLEVRVVDDGVGGARADGPGLLGLRDRLTVLDGRLRVESPPEGGTLVSADIPLGSS